MGKYISSKKSDLLFLLLCLLPFWVSCDKDALAADAEETEVPEAIAKDDDTNSGEKPADVVIGLGNGGDLIIDGNALGAKSGVSITIAGGTYSSITIRNMNGSKDKPIIIRNNKVVTITGTMKTENINYTHIIGNGDTNAKYGFVFLNFRFSAIDMNGQLNGVILQNMQFKNSNNYYCITGNGTNKTQVYDGSSNTKTEDLRILNCEFDNVGRISFGGTLDGNTDHGHFKNIEIAHNTFMNTNAGTVCEFHNVENYDIHHNVVNNVNQTNNNHNGVFYMTGSGKFHHNKLTNYQGNAIRMWVFSRGGTAKTVEIHHNICYNSKKYSAFEIQTFDRNIVGGKTTFVNAKVYNNTVGRMNTSKEWVGQLLDLYDTRGGALEYYNNLGFELVSDKAVTDMIHNMSNASIVKENNRYTNSEQEAIYNTTDFKSKTQGVGAL